MKDRTYFGRDLEAMSFATNYHNWIIDEFRPYLGKSVAEVGAGTGNFSSLLVGTGIKRLVAFEPSENMYPVLRDRMAGADNVTTVNCFFGDKCREYEDEFDSVVYVNVLEHIEHDDSELSFVYSSLRKGGYILVFVPALSWLYSEFDKKLGHFRRYHRKDIVRMMEGAGFDVVHARYFDMAGIIPWYVAFVLLKKSINAGNVTLYDRLVVPIMRKVESIVTPPVGKNILLIGRKA